MVHDDIEETIVEAEPVPQESSTLVSPPNEPMAGDSKLFVPPWVGRAAMTFESSLLSESTEGSPMASCETCTATATRGPGGP